MLRRILITAVVLIVLAVIIAVAGTLILRSAWLGERVLATVSGRLGLDVRAESFFLGWGGDAALNGVSVRMPLRDEVVLSADAMTLRLDAVPLLLLGRSIHVRSMELDNPTVFLRQFENGRWNAQDVWGRVQAGIRSSPPRGRRIQLPQVVVREATIRITDSGGTTQMVHPVQFEGRRRGPLLWGFDLRAPPIARMEGQVVESSDWAHEVRFTVKEIGPLVHSVLRQDLAPIQLAGWWKGSLRHDTLGGVMQFDEFVVGRVALHGGVQVEATSNHAMIRPRRLIVSEPNLAGEAIQLVDGAVQVSRERITLESVAAKAGALGGQIDGHWNPEARRGEFSGSWLAAWPHRSSQFSGTYQFSVRSPREGRKEAQANVTVQARTPVGSWHAVARAQGAGADWRTSLWQVNVPTLAWLRGERQVAVTDAAARIDLQWPQIQLMSLSVPEAKQVNANARFEVRTRQWSAQLAVEQLRMTSLGADALGLRLRAEGDDEKARVSELHVAWNESVVTAQGDLSFVAGGLQNVHVSADWLTRAARTGPARVQQPAGRWHLEAAVTGQVQPVALAAEATLTGQSIALGKRWVDQVQIPVHARVDAEQVEATTPPFDLLGGQWQLTGQYDLSRHATEVHVMATDLSLGAVASMAGLPLTSQGQAHAAITLRMPGLEIQNAVAAGSWSAQDINIPPLAARRAQGVLRIAGGLARLDNIQLEQGSGRARAGVEFRLEEPQIVSIELDAQGWPLQLAERPVTLVVDGRAKLRANVLEKAAEGEARLTSRIVWQDKDVANVRLAALVQGQTVDVREFHAQTLGGSVDGTARIPLNRWVDSVAQLRWQGIEPEQLEAWLPPLERFQGALSGSLVVEQAAARPSSFAGDERRDTSDAQARPLGPTRFVLDANVANGRFGPAEIGASRITGYLDPTRLLVENASFDVLGGRLEVRARVSKRTGDYYGSIVADFKELRLDQLMHAIDPNAGVHVGRLSGTATVLPAWVRGPRPGPREEPLATREVSRAGYPFDHRISLAGEGRINITQSDLVGSGVVRTLYDALNLRFGAREPTGTGEVRVQFAGPAVILSSVQYFNRGVEIRGAGEIKNVNLRADSPIEGYAVASTRVLKGVKLPGIGALDRLLEVFQTGAASVKIGGVLDNVEVQVVPLPEVLGSFRRLLWAQLRE